MTYVDGMICAVPTANKETYRTFSEKAAAVFKEHGAVAYAECWGDDVPEGKLNSMHTAVMRAPDETVVFSWIAWPSKAARDEAWSKVMTDSRLQAEEMPFDGKRLIHGGFEMIVNA